MSGWVYVIINEGMPGLVKVGFTHSRPEDRARELASTGSAYPYAIAFHLQVPDPRSAERLAHEILKDHHAAKEWFKCTVETARAAVETAARSQPPISIFDTPGEEKPKPYQWKSQEERQGWINHVIELAKIRATNVERHDQMMKTYVWCPTCRFRMARVNGSTNLTYLCQRCERTFTQ